MTLSPKSSPTRLWSSILVLALGYGAGMQLGKIAPLIPRMQAELGFSLTFMGWVTSLLGLFVALTAYPVTKLVHRFSPPRSLQFGSIVLSVGAISLGLLQVPALLLAARAVEAIGYVVVVIAAPAYLATRSPNHLRGTFMALWGSFVPVGYVLASLQVEQLPSTWPITQVLLSFAIPIVALTVLAVLTISRKPMHAPHSISRELLSAKGMGVAFAFGLYVYLSIGFFTFLPRYIASFPTSSFPSPALVALFVPVGNVVAAIVLGSLGTKYASSLALGAFLIAGISGSLAFYDPRIDSVVFPLFALSGGLAASSLFSNVTNFAKQETTATSTVGAIAQAGGIATLLGPPIVGSLLENYGWQGLSWSLLAVGLVAGLAIFLSGFSKLA